MRVLCASPLRFGFTFLSHVRKPFEKDQLRALYRFLYSVRLLVREPKPPEGGAGVATKPCYLRAKRVECPHGRASDPYVDSRMVVVLLAAWQPGVTGFDRVGLRWAAGRGLLATLNRGTVKLNGREQLF